MGETRSEGLSKEQMNACVDKALEYAQKFDNLAEALTSVSFTLSMMLAYVDDLDEVKNALKRTTDVVVALHKARKEDYDEEDD